MNLKAKVDHIVIGTPRHLMLAQIFDCGFI